MCLLKASYSITECTYSWKLSLGEKFYQFDTCLLWQKLFFYPALFLSCVNRQRGYSDLYRIGEKLILQNISTIQR